MQKIELIKLCKNKRCLVVDDFAEMRISMKQMAIGLGFGVVDTAANAIDALENHSQEPYDIILSDYNLGGGKNGQQVLEELRHRELLPRTSIYIIVTAEVTKDMVFGALEYRPDDYLSKPFTTAVLQQRLSRILQEKKALQPIDQAIDQKQFKKAIGLAANAIKAGCKYQSKLKQLLGFSAYQAGDYDLAKRVYETMLAEHKVEWAMVGLGKTLQALRDLEGAEAIFRQLVEDESRCMEVFDRLAEILLAKGRVEEARNFLFQGIDISPRSVQRQEMLADACLILGDLATAESAQRQVLKLAEHSLHESPEKSFNLVRCIIQQLDSEQSNPKRIKEIGGILQNTVQKYKGQKAVLAQSKFVEAGLYTQCNNQEKAQSLMAEAVAVAEKLSQDSQLIGVQIEHAKALAQMGDKVGSKEILVCLADSHPEDEELSSKLDKLCGEAVSHIGKARAKALNKEGNQLLEDEEFSRAVGLFSEAARLFPNNINVNLNLLLALTKQMESEGARADYIDWAKQVIEKIGTVSSDHPLYQRLSILQKSISKLENQHAA